MISKKLRKPCKDCEKYFVPYSKFCKLCPNCFKRHRKELVKTINLAWKKKKLTKLEGGYNS